MSSGSRLHHSDPNGGDHRQCACFLSPYLSVPYTFLRLAISLALREKRCRRGCLPSCVMVFFFRLAMRTLVHSVFSTLPPTYDLTSHPPRASLPVHFSYSVR